MPYIVKQQREHLDPIIHRLSTLIREAASKHDMPPSNDDLVGVINYTVTRVVMKAFNVKRGQLRYAQVNAIVGVLKCVSDEFYRRLAADYEIAKEQDNGDVPEYEFHQPVHDFNEQTG